MLCIETLEYKYGFHSNNTKTEKRNLKSLVSMHPEKAIEKKTNVILSTNL